MLRRVLALLSVFSVVIAAAACTTAVVEEETTTVTQLEIPSTAAPIEENSTVASEETTEAQTTEAATQQATTEAATQAIAETTAAPVTEAPSTAAPVDDTTGWSTEKILDFYKNAAQTTGGSVKSEQTIELQDISVNNGQLGGIFSFVTPILNSFLSSSSTATNGITGDFNQLSEADISYARAYTSSNGTVVEISLNTQTDTGSADRSDGSVAHGISVVGDLTSVFSQLKDKGLPLDVPVDNTVISYTNPVIKAVVDSNGKIINGTWSCTVEISLSDYKFAGSTVDSTVVVLNNNITVNGGFNP